MTTASNFMTAEELYALPNNGALCELVRGERRMMTPAGYDHSRIVGRLHTWLGAFALQHGLGEVMPADAGFLLSRNPDTLRAPDVSFIRTERLTPEREGPFFPGAPDLAVEVISPNDRSGEIDEKVQDWLHHGCQVVWLVNPKWRTVTIYRSDTDIQTLTEADTLEEPTLLPGFSLPVGKVFDFKK